jgi:hypothetical protein
MRRFESQLSPLSCNRGGRLNHLVKSCLAPRDKTCSNADGDFLYYHFVSEAEWVFETSYLKELKTMNNVNKNNSFYENTPASKTSGARLLLNARLINCMVLLITRIDRLVWWIFPGFSLWEQWRSYTANRRVQVSNFLYSVSLLQILMQSGKFVPRAQVLTGRDCQTKNRIA